MHIRPVHETDAPGIAAVVHAMKELSSVTGQPAEATAATIRENLRRLAASGTSAAWLAEDATGTTTGYCTVHWVPLLFFRGGEAYVTELFVRPADTGQGIGSALLETAVAEARRRGCARVSLLNGRDVDSYAREFYKKRGWTERDRMANFILTLG